MTAAVFPRGSPPSLKQLIIGRDLSSAQMLFTSILKCRKLQ